MANLIDWSEVEASIAATKIQQSCDTRSQALAYVVLPALFSFTADEVDEALTDGPNDRGIDAVVILDTAVPPVVHLFQFKCVEKFERATDNFPGSAVDKLLSFVRDLLAKDPALEKTCNPILWGKVCEIWDLFKGATPRFVVHLVANQATLVSTEQARLHSGLTPYRHFSTLYTDLSGLATLLTERNRPKFNAALQLVDLQYFERSDGNIRGLIATIQATELVKLVRDPGDTDQVNRDVFDENIRVYLTRKNRINQKIFETATSLSNAEFWYLNNGVTMTCDSFEYPPGVRAPLVHLTGVQIMNGGQTSNALFEAAREAPNELAKVLLLARIYELKNRDMAGRVAESTNSQTPVRSRDLRANDEIQRKLAIALLPKGVYYERKAFQHKDQARDKRLDALAAAQALVAYFNGWPEVATKDRGKLFGELYDSIFNEDLTAEQLLSSSQVFEAILSLKRGLEAAIRKGLSFEPKQLFLIDGAYYVLFALGRLCELRGLERLDVPTATGLLPSILRLVEGVVETEKASDPAFAHKRFFKSKRARILIEDAIRKLPPGTTPEKAVTGAT